MTTRHISTCTCTRQRIYFSLPSWGDWDKLLLMKAQSLNSSPAAFSRPGSNSRLASLFPYPGLTSQKQPSGIFFICLHSHWFVLVQEDTTGDWTSQELTSSSANVRGLKWRRTYYMPYTTQDRLHIHNMWRVTHSLHICHILLKNHAHNTCSILHKYLTGS